MFETSHTSIKHGIPIVAVVVMFRFTALGVLSVLRTEAKHEKPRGVLLCECGVLRHYTTKTHVSCRIRSREASWMVFAALRASR